MVKQRQSPAAVELTQEQEELAQRIYQRLQTKLNEELLAMARLMASKADHEIFGKGAGETNWHSRVRINRSAGDGRRGREALPATGRQENVRPRTDLAMACPRGAKAEPILDFYHASEHVAAMAAACHPQDPAAAAEQTTAWCHQLKHEGGAALSAIWERIKVGRWRQTRREVYRQQLQYFRNYQHQMTIRDTGSGDGKSAQDRWNPAAKGSLLSD